MSRTPAWSYESSFEVDPRSASRARAFVTRHLVDHQLFDLVDSIRLVTSELATNAVVHSQGAFTVSLSGQDNAVLLAVQDTSPSPPVPRTAEVMDTSGRGMMLVSMLSQDWGVTADGEGLKTVWASFARRLFGAAASQPSEGAFEEQVVARPRRPSA